MSAHFYGWEDGYPVVYLDDPVPAPAAPPPPDAAELARRRDAVRDAAREFETLSPQDVKERLRGTTTRTLGADEVSSFASDVRDQALDDMVDVLDQTIRGKKRGRRTVRLGAPRGYVKKALNAMTTDELRQLVARLSARGVDDALAEVGRRVSPAKLADLQEIS